MYLCIPTEQLGFFFTIALNLVAFLGSWMNQYFRILIIV